MHNFFESRSTPEEEAIKARMEKILTLLADRSSPGVYSMFCEPKLYENLPEEVRSNDELLAEYVRNTGKFVDLIYDEIFDRSNKPKILGQNTHIPETQHADGSMRRAENGHLIDLEAVKKNGIDPEKVLFFRVTQPSDKPKPEYYWTTDFYETQRGLSQEISPEKRRTAITLVANLKTIAGDQGVIKDLNDDQGVAVRQISTEPFDTSKCLSVIPAAEVPNTPPGDSDNTPPDAGKLLFDF
jgi:hypothetical protein